MTRPARGVVVPSLVCQPDTHMGQEYQHYVAPADLGWRPDPQLAFRVHIALTRLGFATSPPTVYDLDSPVDEDEGELPISGDLLGWDMPPAARVAWLTGNVFAAGRLFGETDDSPSPYLNPMDYLGWEYGGGLSLSCFLDLSDDYLAEDWFGGGNQVSLTAPGGDGLEAYELRRKLLSHRFPGGGEAPKAELPSQYSDRNGRPKPTPSDQHPGVFHARLALDFGKLPPGFAVEADSAGRAPRLPEEVRAELERAFTVDLAESFCWA